MRGRPAGTPAWRTTASVSVKNGYTLGADNVGPDGRQLTGVFVERRDGQGEEIITSKTGQLTPSSDGNKLLLGLANGMIVTDRPDGSVRTVLFSDAHLNEDFTAVPPPFRPRGDSVRELTLPELRQPPPAGETAKHMGVSARAGEFQGRIARSILPLLLPLLALPLGMAAKRGRRAPGTVFATIALLALNQSLNFGESLGEAAASRPGLRCGHPVAVFAVFGIWLFRSSLQWPGDNPVMRAVSAIEAGFDGLHRKKPAKK